MLLSVIKAIYAFGVSVHFFASILTFEFNITTSFGFLRRGMLREKQSEF